MNRYSVVINKLLAGEVVYVKLDSETNFDTLRTSVSREKTRHEDELRAFEIPFTETRLQSKQLKNSTVKFTLIPVAAPLQILSTVPPLEDTLETNGRETEENLPSYLGAS